MATQKINFTKEHQARLEELILKMLFGNIVVSGLMGITLNAHQLLNEATINTLTNLYTGLKKSIEALEAMDSWSMTPHQEKKLKTMKETQELINLAIGYKKYQTQVATEKQQIKALKAKVKELEAESLTPVERIKALKEEINSMGGDSVTEDDDESAE